MRRPSKRAILQSSLWALFDQVSDANGADQANRKSIAQRCAQIISRLALSDTELAALPDNFATAIRSKEFAAEYDPGHRERAFLPPDLFDASGPWVMMAGSDSQQPAAIRHVEFTQGRSVFYVLIRLPGGRGATLTYLGNSPPSRGPTSGTRRTPLIPTHAPSRSRIRSCRSFRRELRSRSCGA